MITACAEDSCVDYISVSFALFVYTCEDPAYYVLAAVGLNPWLSLTINKGTEILSLFYFLFLSDLRTNQPVPTFIYKLYWLMCRVTL